MSSARGNFHHPTPEYGKNVSVYEALGSKRSFPSVTLDRHGISLRIDSRALEAHVEQSEPGSMKLAAFLVQNYDILPAQIPDSGCVIDLDCRNGLAGIAAVQLGYPHVIFAEASAQVLRTATWPNIVLNCPNNVASCKCVLAGSWVALSEHLSIPGETKWSPLYLKFELVLATAPNVQNTVWWEKMHCLLHRHLTPTGLALINVTAGISENETVPLTPLLRHTLYKSQACDGTSTYDIVGIRRGGN